MILAPKVRRSPLLLIALAAGSVWACETEPVVVFEGDAAADVSSSSGGSSAAAGGTGGATTLGGANSGGVAAAGGSGGLSGTGGGTQEGGAAGFSDAGSGGIAAGGAAGRGGRGGGHGEPEPCFHERDCPPSWLCRKDFCGQELGTCEPRPVFCPPDALPVCGCNDVTYWNDCVRLQAGEAAAMPGPCGPNAARCNQGLDCGVQGASCSHLYPGGSCEAPGNPSVPGGVCWLLPIECPPDPQRWVACAPPGSPPGPAVCTDTCGAIRAEKPAFPAGPDFPCSQ